MEQERGVAAATLGPRRRALVHQAAPGLQMVDFTRPSL